MTIQTDMAGEATVADPRDLEIAALRNDITSLQIQLQGARKDHRNDIAVIGARLLQEAESHDWCNDFDEVVEEVNALLTIPLPERETEVEVEVTGTLTVPFRHTVIVTVRGRRSDDAIKDAVDEAMDNIGAQDVDTDIYGAEVIEWEIDNF